MAVLRTVVRLLGVSGSQQIRRQSQTSPRAYRLSPRTRPDSPRRFTPSSEACLLGGGHAVFHELSSCGVEEARCERPNN